MTDEKIIEIARRYDPYAPDFVMTADTLIAFARAVIEADRESSERPAYWLLPGGVIVEYNPETYGREGTAVGVLYRRPAPARKPLSEDEITEIMLANGFTIKDGCDGLKPYVFKAVRAIEKAHGIGEAE